MSHKVLSGLCFKITQFVRQGRTDAEIAAYLNERLPRSYFGQPWTPRAVRRFAKRFGLPVPVSPLPTPKGQVKPPVSKVPTTERKTK